jgi:hypothetical protein
MSKGCNYPYIGLYYYQTKDEAEYNDEVPKKARQYYDWAIVAFHSYKQYKTFPYKGFDSETINIDPSVIMYCEAPFLEAAFPYGDTFPGV